MPPLLLRLENICLDIVSGRSLVESGFSCGNILEDVSRIEELGIYELWCQKIATDDEDLGRDISKRLLDTVEYNARICT